MDPGELHRVVAQAIAEAEPRYGLRQSSAGWDAQAAAAVRVVLAEAGRAVEALDTWRVRDDGLIERTTDAQVALINRRAALAVLTALDAPPPV